MRTLIALGMVVALAQASEIQDVTWTCKTSKCFLEFDFEISQGLPGFAQMYDPVRKELRIAFGNTQTSALGRQFEISPGSSGLQGIRVFQDITPSGKRLCVFALRVGKDIHTQQNPVTLEKGHLFRVELPTSKPAKKWRLSKAARQAAPAPSQKIAAPEVKPVVVPPAPPRPKPVVKDEEDEKQTVIVENLKFEGKEGVKGAKELPRPLQKISWVRGFGLEQFVVDFHDDVIQFITRTDSTWIIVLTRGAKEQSLLMDIDGSSLIRYARIVQRSMNSYQLVLWTRNISSNLVQKNDHRIMIQDQVMKTPGLEIWEWQGKHTRRQMFIEKNTEEGEESLQNFASAFEKRPVSTSQTFTLRPGVLRDLIVVAEKDAVLRDQPSSQGNVIRTLQFGDRLQSMDVANKLFYKVKIGEMVGFVNRRQASYPDELSHTQNEKLKNLVEQGKQAETIDSNGSGDAGLALLFEDPSQDRITYSSFGRRDPFIELEGVVDEGINIDAVELVGIIWESEVPMVLLSDIRNPGVSYTLKEGDNILNGKVLKITQDEVLFLINEVGVSRRYTMTLPDKYGGKQ